MKLLQIRLLFKNLTKLFRLQFVFDFCRDGIRSRKDLETIGVEHLLHYFLDKQGKA